MWHRLALALGRSVRECQASIDSREFSSWIAYYDLEPFGYEIENYRSGIIATAIINTMTKKRVSTLDFFKREKKSKGWQDLLAKVVALNALFGGTDERSIEPSND